MAAVDSVIVIAESGDALTQLGSVCRILRILDVCKMRNGLRKDLRNACLNHPTI